MAISTVPTTRSPNISGNNSANAMMVMPPIECPTSTSGPSGVVASITRRSVRPSRSRSYSPVSSRPERPCPGWSYATIR